MLNREKIEGTIGKGFADKMDELVMDASEELSFTRREMIEDIGCANFIAAATLSKVLKRLNITTVKQLWATDPFSLVRSKRIGEAAMYVAMCILDTRKYSVVKWWGWKGNDVKFSTFKHNATRKASRRKHEV